MKNGDKDYHKMQNQNRITLRLTAEELAILEIEMAEEGYGNKTAFVKNRLFGQNLKRKIRAKIQSRDFDAITTLLKHYLREMADWFHYTVIVVKSFFNTNVENSRKKDFALDKLVTLTNHAKMMTRQITAICVDLNLPVRKLLKEDLPNVEDCHKAFIMKLEQAVFASGQTSVFDPFDKFITAHGLVIEITHSENEIACFLLYCKGRMQNEHTMYECYCKSTGCPGISSYITVNGALELVYLDDTGGKRRLMPRIIVKRITYKEGYRNESDVK